MLLFCLGLLLPGFAKAEDPASPVSIDVNIPARHLKLYQGEEVVYEFPVAVGQPAYKTPVGHYELEQMVWNPWWLPPKSGWAKDEKPTPPGPKNPLGPVKMILGDAIMMHGTTKESSVGHAASHGCMRMYNQDAKTLAWWLQSHLSEKNDVALFDQYGKKTRTSFYVKLEEAVPVTIHYDLYEMKDRELTVYPDIYARSGDRKEKLLGFLAERGIPPESVDKKSLEDLLVSSSQKTVTCSLEELMPGQWRVNPHPLPNLITQDEEVFKVRRSTQQASLNPMAL